MQTRDFVRVENDNQCNIVGVGSVQIKTHVGMTRTLTRVKHIPSMARNLISLSTLDCGGYKYKGGDRRMKVSSGSLVVMIGDMNSAKLYVLRGTLCLVLLLLLVLMILVILTFGISVLDI
jgi:hypothetical protein